MQLKQWAFGVVVMFVAAGPARAQDTRTVTEPTFPATCTTLAAQQAISAGEPASETTFDTSRIQAALSACATGQAVELTSSGSNNAFLIGPIAVPTGRTLIVDGGVTVFGSRNPADYQISALDTCGTVSANGNGCYALITVGENAPGGTSTSTGAGLMGYGVINGRGGDKLIVGGVVGSESWWDIANDARSGGSQNNPILVSLYKANSSVLYKITLINSPMFHVKNNYSVGFTTWDAKIITPWTARNTDGIDPGGTTNVSIVNSFIGDGDDEIAIGGSSAATGFSFTNLQLISGHGVSIGSYTNAGVSNVLASGLYFSGQAADSNQGALRIKSAQDRGGLVQNIAYQNVCVKNVKAPIILDPFYDTNSGTSIPQYKNITYKNVHVLTEGTIQLQGHDVNNVSTINFDNVVFDTLNTSDLTADPPLNLSITPTGTGFVYPTLLSTLNTVAGASNVTYASAPTVSNANALACSNVFTSLITEMYASSTTATNLQSVNLTNPGSVTLNATVEPANSQKTYAYTYSGKTSTYTGVAAPTGPVQFLEGTTVVGTASFGANGTLASASISNPTVGTHTYTASYSGDSNYAATTFGSITVNVSAGVAAKLVFSTPPPATFTYGGSAGTVAVAVQDGAGDATASTAAVTLTVTGSGYSQTYSATAVAGTATFSLGAVLPVGNYTYTATSGSLVSATASETVTAATLTVTASAASRIFDAPNPAFGYTVTGFVNGDPSTVVTGAAAITTTATRTSNAGSYPTTVSLGTLAAANYNFTLIGSTLTVTGGAAQTILFAALPNFASGGSYQLTARTTSGISPTYTVTGPAQVSGATLSVTGAGLVTVTAHAGSNANYASAADVAQNFTAP